MKLWKRALAAGLAFFSASFSASAAAPVFGERDLEIQNTRLYLQQHAYSAKIRSELRSDPRRNFALAHEILEQLPPRLQVPELVKAIQDFVTDIGEPGTGAEFQNSHMGDVLYLPLLGISFVGSASFVVVGGVISYYGAYSSFSRENRKTLTDDEVSTYLNDGNLDHQIRDVVDAFSTLLALSPAQETAFRDQIMNQIIEEIAQKTSPLQMRPIEALRKIGIDEPILTETVRFLKNSMNAKSEPPPRSFDRKLAYNIVSTMVLQQTLERDRQLSDAARASIRQTLDSSREVFKKITVFYEL